jgi:PAS domain S-box-containing protein
MSMAGSTELQAAHEIAIDASPTGVVVCDEGGVILFANPQVEAIFGYGAKELVGATVDLLLPERLRPTHGAERARFWADPNSRRMGAGRELLGRRKDGSEVPVEIGLSVATRDGRRMVIASVVDITERRRLQLELERAAADRLAFERLVSELAARFVHLLVEEVDEAMIDSQRRIVQALDLDRGALLQFTDQGTDLVLTHLWARPEFPPITDRVSTRDTFPWIFSKLRANEAVWITRAEDVPDPMDRESLARVGTKAAAVIPLTLNEGVIGAVSFASLRTERSWDPEIRERLRLLASIFAQALARRRGQQDLRKALAEIERLRDQLALENVQLRNEVKTLKGPQSIAAESEAVRRVLAQIESVARTSATVLLLGETGSGKQVFAEAIHAASDRSDRQMVRVNCAAIPTALIESELFGRERGAYTGALSRQVGRFELADRSTIFLDELGDLPIESQAKLLRVIQDRVVERLGSVRPIKVDVRIIAATNRDLERAVTDRTFREDLFYRLNVFPITIPPLRERVEDIPVLAWTFIDEFAKAFNKKIDSISKDSLLALQQYPWPGNVRELRNVIERAVIVAKGPRLIVETPNSGAAERRDSDTLSEVEAEHIQSVLKRVGWRVRGIGGAAELLGMRPTTLDSRMAKLGIRRPGR